MGLLRPPLPTGYIGLWWDLVSLQAAGGRRSLNRWTVPWQCLIPRFLSGQIQKLLYLMVVTKICSPQALASGVVSRWVMVFRRVT